jgi:hypothetical protein
MFNPNSRQGDPPLVLGWSSCTAEVQCPPPELCLQLSGWNLGHCTGYKPKAWDLSQNGYGIPQAVLNERKLAGPEASQTSIPDWVSPSPNDKIDGVDDARFDRDELFQIRVDAKCRAHTRDPNLPVAEVCPDRWCTSH